jgi:hypothetical protein
MSQAIFQSVLVVFGILFQVLITSFIQPMGFKLNWGPDDFDNPRVSPWKSVDTVFGNYRRNLV